MSMGLVRFRVGVRVSFNIRLLIIHFSYIGIQSAAPPVATAWSSPRSGGINYTVTLQDRQSEIRQF